MARPAERALERILASHPSAVVESRERSSLTADVGDGRRALVSTIGALHYDDGGWQEIDTAWQATAGAWQLEMLTAPYQASARDSFSAGEIVEYRARSGEWVRFQPLALNWRDSDGSTQQIAIPQAVATQVAGDEGDVLSWPSGYGAGRDFSWVAHPTRLQKLLTIQAPSDLPTPTVAGSDIELDLTFAFTFDSTVTAFVDGEAWDRSVTRTTGNAIEFRSSSGETLWHFTSPRAWDSVGSETTGVMSFYRVGNTRHVAVRIPRAFVDEAVFPLFLDPTIDVDIAAGADDVTATNAGGFFVTETGLGAGHSGGGNILNSGYRFMLLVPGGATVVAATLSSHALSGSSAGTDCNTILRGEAADSAAQITSNADFFARTRTTANVAWNAIPAWSVNEELKASPDLTGVVQEVAGREGWSAGGRINIFWEDNGSGTGSLNLRIWAAYEHATLGPPALYVEYEGAEVLETTLTPDGTVSSSGVVDQGAGTTNLHEAVDEPFGTPDDDTTYLVNSGSASGEVTLTLSDTPSDFGEMVSLTVRVRLRRE